MTQVFFLSYHYKKRNLFVRASLFCILPCVVLLLFGEILTCLLNLKCSISSFLPSAQLTQFTLEIEPRKCCSGWIPPCWDSSRAGLPGSIVKGQSVSSLCFLAAQVPTLQMKASHQKPIHFLAIIAWNQAGDLAASDIPCYSQETEVCLACQFLSTVLVSLSWCSSFLQSFYLLCKQNAGGDSSRCCTFSEDEDVDVAMSIYTLNFSRSFHDCLRFVQLILAPQLSY